VHTPKISNALAVTIETCCMPVTEGNWYHSEEDERCSVWFQ